MGPKYQVEDAPRVVPANVSSAAIAGIRFIVSPRTTGCFSFRAQYRYKSVALRTTIALPRAVADGCSAFEARQFSGRGLAGRMLRKTFFATRPIWKHVTDSCYHLTSRFEITVRPAAPPIWRDAPLLSGGATQCA